MEFAMSVLMQAPLGPLTKIFIISRLHLCILTFQGAGDVGADERATGFIYGSQLYKSTWHSCSFSQVRIYHHFCWGFGFRMG